MPTDAYWKDLSDVSLLASISGPADLRDLTREQLNELAWQVRDFLVEQVSRTGGHLGPNLGVVELTIALHRVFDSPRDSIVFDTGHIAYVHKLLTGRQDFGGLRSRGGLSGYPCRAESAHDVVENSHASGSLSWAAGIARGRRLRGQTDRRTVAIIGDGALTGGMAWEALNDIAADKDLPLTIIVNDNERSYAPTGGGLAEHLAQLRISRGYEDVLSWGRRTLTGTPVVGQRAFEALHGIKKGLKDIVAPQVMFEDLGLKYIGPVDGHDLDQLHTALRRARDFDGPVLVHVLTEKGHGYEPARNHEDDQFHAVGVINPETGLPLEIAGRSWTDTFSDALGQIGAQRPEVVALTAAMLIPVGLRDFAAAHPERVFDVGIAEQHGVAMAAGLAFTGLHPVVAVYSTFLNRAFDQVLMDCALHRAGVTFVLDRAGATGNDGPSHNGMWDMSLLGVVPGLRLAAPRDGETLAQELAEAVAVTDGPTVLRFPKGTEPSAVPALERADGLDVLARHGVGPGESPDVLIVAVGSMAPLSLEAGAKIAAQGHRVEVVDPRWVLPVAPALVARAAGAGSVAVVEDGVVSGGIGDRIAGALAAAGVSTPVHRFGLPKEFIEHASRAQVLTDAGLTAEQVADRLIDQLGPAAPTPRDTLRLA
ncbi:1-deoxy-D-xylulose-5-phosphate synthase [Kineosphaera limosa]|uniref:1-deoxy-D-xylulose-5-phosphate synthase n=1 Tax=Kineosphaera limosa NBRC 100340 TaxID=1184609 RepID=K6VEX7_9MICO|nr:1-deoxy-D-xylulose-5-phosphate synthase [Kineosphaera limosa]NYD98931.1 1-deoxy-D-xylulose-5-phosphate synthase [Kineosphaera limosa]GAB94743.1 1-deoxy-D-xylulose-5-phosphate synthase [Kineosphaera limosa NBRC 100340]